MRTRTPDEGFSALTDDAERNQLLAEMAEKSTDMISRHTPEDWRFIYASPAVTHLLGYTVEEIVGLSAYDLYHPDDVEDFRLRAPTVNYDRGLYTHTYRFRCKDGHYTWLESTSRTIRDPDTNEIREILVVSRDATHRIKADNANRRLARVLESTQDLVLFLNLDHTLSHINEAARTALELEQVDYSVLPLAWFVSERGLEYLLKEGFPSAIQSGYWRGELWMRSRQGKRIPVVLELLAHRSLHGDVEYFSIVAHDLTEKKAAEEQLKQYQADLDHAGRLVTMGELASSLAHELNQPLAAMVNYLRGVERRFAGSDSLSWQELELPITRSISTALRAGEIVHRMMDFTRKQEPQMEDLALEEVIDHIVEFCDSMAERHGVVLEVSGTGELPSVRADRIQLEQVLLNLVVNAIEASGNGEEEPLNIVSIQLEPHGQKQVRVSVNDQGPGIDRQDLDRLFTRFYSTKKAGLGMGLAISRSLVENLGGELWAENRPEKGARFSFTLNMSE
ncbi:PAS domain-containing sensor histidine kinase [Marinobacter piscensis]|uniref:PAS domain-containing sensor histidine kinase n=1 Tax=Marinobacter piscensis TaxID=1562308 RepID=UPI0011A58862|nr:ATP-binding protein [Marinobacter piscensis]